MTLKNPKVYSDSYQFAIQIFYRTKAFQKALRPTLGRRLEESALDLVVAVRAFSVAKSGSATKANAISRASRILDEMRIVLQMSYDMHQLGDSGYGELCELSAAMGKQFGGLLKHLGGGGSAGQEEPAAS